MIFFVENFFFINSNAASSHLPAKINNRLLIMKKFPVVNFIAALIVSLYCASFSTAVAATEASPNGISTEATAAKKIPAFLIGYAASFITKQKLILQLIRFKQQNRLQLHQK